MHMLVDMVSTALNRPHALRDTSEKVKIGSILSKVEEILNLIVLANSAPSFCLSAGKSPLPYIFARDQFSKEAPAVLQKGVLRAVRGVASSGAHRGTSHPRCGR